MLIDSHCHLPHKKYKLSTDVILSQAKEAGIVKVINIGTSLKDNLEVLEVSKNYEQVYSCIGIYPHEEINADISSTVMELEKQVKSSTKVVGIGECGIDITEWENQRPVNSQIQLFEAQLELAQKLELPIVIHNRNGNEHVLGSLKNFPKVTGVVHCFTSDWNFAKKVLDLGFYISFSGIITYESGKNLHESVEKVPNDRFLVETDAPYLAPSPYKNQLNYPKYVKITAQKVSELKKIPLKKVEEFSYNNTSRLFKLNYD